MLSTLPLFYIAQSVNSDDRRTRIQGLRVIMKRFQAGSFGYFFYFVLFFIGLKYQFLTTMSQNF